MKFSSLRDEVWGPDAKMNLTVTFGVVKAPSWSSATFVMVRNLFWDTAAG
jgi:hypothetical protein